VEAVRHSLEPLIRSRPATAVAEAWRHPVAGPALKVVLGYVFLVEGLVQLVFGRIDIPFVDIGFLEVGTRHAPIPRGIFLGGMVIGSLYAMLGIGLILVYRANRIINFAQAQLGAVPAVLALLLVAREGWPYLAVIPIVIVGGALLGAGVEVAIVRRFSDSPRLILTVVTIGIGVLLLVAEYLVKEGITGSLIDTLSLEFPTPFAGMTLDLGPTRLTGDHFFAVALSGACVAGLAAFFRYTDIGIAVRASAENGERASLLGIPVKRVSTVVWMVAAVLSAVAIFLRGPLVGLPLTGFLGPSLLLLGLAAAVIARMESVPRALVAGMFIGIVDRAALFSTRRAGMATATMLVLIVVALLVQRGTLSRAQEIGASTWQAVRDFRPVPTELRLLPEVVWARTALAVVVGVLALAAPFYIQDQRLLVTMVLYAIIGVSLVILTGWAGQISLGQFAIAAVGAATAGGLAANHGWDFFLALFVGGLAGAFVAVLIGLPAVRIQGLFLAVTTLALAFTVHSVVLSREYFGWLLPGGNGYIDRPVIYGRIDLASRVETEFLGMSFSRDARFYYVALAFLVLALAAARALRRNRSGRILIGVRDNARLAQSFGVSPARTRLAAFAISGFIAAVAGGLYGFLLEAVPQDAFIPEKSIELFVMTVIGGIGSLAGAMMGAVYVLGAPLLPVIRELDTQIVNLLTSGLGLLVLLAFLPGGLAEGAFRIRDTYLRWVAARHGLHVPSLVADSLVTDEDATAPVVDADFEESLAALGSGGQTITCPACRMRVPVAEAALHPHFADEPARSGS